MNKKEIEIKKLLNKSERLAKAAFKEPKSNMYKKHIENNININRRLEELRKQD